MPQYPPLKVVESWIDSTPGKLTIGLVNLLVSCSGISLRTSVHFKQYHWSGLFERLYLPQALPLDHSSEISPVWAIWLAWLRLVPDFGGQYLDMDPNSSQYWHFCGTINDVTYDRNPYKMGTTHHMRWRLSAKARLYLKVVIVKDISVLQNASNRFF